MTRTELLLLLLLFSSGIVLLLFLLLLLHLEIATVIILILYEKLIHYYTTTAAGSAYVSEDDSSSPSVYYYLFRVQNYFCRCTKCYIIKRSRFLRYYDDIIIQVIRRVLRRYYNNILSSRSKGNYKRAAYNCINWAQKPSAVCLGNRRNDDGNFDLQTDEINLCRFPIFMYTIIRYRQLARGVGTLKTQSA